ncbi:unnamed protein product [Pleuronectes platessa]|uniref:Matrilin coiled-coil trimerisation domain-containing protein n=1 Tax=Pleuronectes platessa TaxID=8262 RepID=A0A9N7YSM4_PLEPL|nr:unnamed protein product [Pleuronectes platessa]
MGSQLVVQSDSSRKEGPAVHSQFSLKTHSKLDTVVKNNNVIVPLAQGLMTGLVDGRPHDRVAEVAAEAREKTIEIFETWTCAALLDLNCYVCPDAQLLQEDGKSCGNESQGEIEVKDPCACESLVEFQQVAMSSLEQLTQKHIL